MGKWIGFADEPESDANLSGLDRVRFVDRFDSRLVNVLTVVGFGLPLIGYFWMLHRFSVNVIVGDQWDDVTVIAHSYTNLFDWHTLWAQHNENRIFFPNLIVIALSRTTLFNIQIEEYLSAVMLVVATGFFIWAHRRRARATPWLYYCPVLLLAFSIVQYENTLEGFQMAWYLVLLSLATALLLLDRTNLTWLTFAGAVVAGVVGSFSSVQGLLIWPAGLVLLYHRRRSKLIVAIWILSAATSTVIYFHNLNANEGSPDHGYAIHHPLAAVKFYVFAVGDILGFAQQYGRPENVGVLLLGVVILALAGISVMLYGIRRDDHGPAPVGVALICFGLLFAAMITEGRILFGASAASQSRYTTFDLLIPLGIYLTLLGRPDPAQNRQTSLRPGGESIENARRRGGRSTLGNRDLVPLARWAIGIVFVIQAAFGFHFGLERARVLHADMVVAAHVLRNINHTTNTTVEFPLDPYYPESFVRHQAHIAELHHLSLFANP
jgi:hypothetical protein